nr:f2.4 [Tranosema rostrale ichnovirus]
MTGPPVAEIVSFFIAKVSFPELLSAAGSTYGRFFGTSIGVGISFSEAPASTICSILLVSHVLESRTFFAAPAVIRLIIFFNRIESTFGRDCGVLSAVFAMIPGIRDNRWKDTIEIDL